jgi:hypothetical protein
MVTNVGIGGTGKKRKEKKRKEPFNLSTDYGDTGKSQKTLSV